MRFPEEILHYIWQFRKFSPLGLKTVCGQTLRIMHTGFYNRNSGPDFTSAQIHLGDTAWAGCVEIHIRSSNWLEHGHQHDPAYDNVILHVVYQSDATIWRRDGTAIPELELKELIDHQIFERFYDLLGSGAAFPCFEQVSGLGSLTIAAQLQRSALQRIEGRTGEVQYMLARNNGNWVQTSYQWILKTYGFHVNTLPLEMLATAIPEAILSRHRDNLFQIEALLLGQAGFLENKPGDIYGRQLRKEYQFLRKKYTLHPLSLAVWKFMRLRPANFPTLRIAQFAAFFHRTDRFLPAILETPGPEGYQKLLGEPEVSSYWQSHYHFHSRNKKHSVRMGKTSVDLLIINGIVPLLIAYGKYTAQPSYVEKGIELLENLPPEKNVITQLYTGAGMPLRNASETQGVFELKRKMCDQKKCLSCLLGAELLR